MMVYVLLVNLCTAPAPADEAFVDRLQRAAWAFFLAETHPQTGLTKDRAATFGTDRHTVASLAATGFQLAALPVAVSRGWLTRDEAVARATTTLRTALDKLPEEHGWLPHFVDWSTGERVWECEYSSIDTGLFLAGALVAGAAFGGDVERLVTRFDQRLDFVWMLDGGETLSHGWKPESGFLRYRWAAYSEHLVLSLLALGSPSHPVPASLWQAWRRSPDGEYDGLRTFEGPLFLHQYPACYIDWRGRKDGALDTWQVAVNATLIAQRWAAKDPAAKALGYGPDFWGVSACDTPTGYQALRGPPGRVIADGTISPWNIAASLPFAPEVCLPTLRTLQGQADHWGRYGFPSGLNASGWRSPDTVGIDAGAALLAIENYRTGQVWSWYMGLPRVQAGLRAAGLGRAGE